MDNSAEKNEMLARAVDLAVKNVAAGGGPFAALVVTADGRVFEGANRVTADNDPTAHAEVTAIRHACRELGTFDLGGATLYTSCEPCPMCLSSALWARIEHVYYAADRHDAAAAGFDDAAFYDYIERRRSSPLVRVVDVTAETSLEPCDAWRPLDTTVGCCAPSRAVGPGLAFTFLTPSAGDAPSPRLACGQLGALPRGDG